jgi:hypothetical protein
MMLITRQPGIIRNALIFCGFHKGQVAAMSFMQRADVQ